MKKTIESSPNAAEAAARRATHDETYKDEREEFDRYIYEVMQGAEIVGPITLRREYDYPEVTAVLDSFEEVQESEYNSRWHEKRYFFGLDGEEDDLSVVQVLEGKFTTAFARGGYVGTRTSMNPETEQLQIDSLGMPEGHTTPVVRRAVKMVIEKREEEGWEYKEKPLGYREGPAPNKTIAGRIDS